MSDDALILDTVEKFLERDVRPVARALELADEYPHEIVEKMKDLGLFGATIAERYGGLGLSASTYARIVDWDQLPNGLLGIVIEGRERFDVQSVWREPDGLIKAEGQMLAMPEPIPMPDEFEGLSEVLTGLLRHPQIQRLQLDHDPDNAWSVAAQLAQLLPIDERIKYSLQGLESAEQLLEEMDKILTELSGESGS